MEKILATLYLIGVFFTAFIFVAFYVSEVISKWKNRNSIVEYEPEEIFEPEVDLVGKSKTAFIASLIPEKHEPLMSEDIEREHAVETEPAITPDDVEIAMSKPYIPDEDELSQYTNDDMDVTGDFSQGLTYQQISQAIDVVEGRKTGENEEYIAGETFCLMADDFLHLICMQSDYEKTVKKLIAGYVDSVGKMLPKPDIIDFDINRYV